MKEPDFIPRIDLNPEPSGSRYTLHVGVSSEFLDYAKKTRIFHARYEEFTRMILEDSGWDRTLLKSPFCFWEKRESGEKSGLLYRIHVPGNAAGLTLIREGEDHFYHSDNIDGVGQIFPILAVMTKYFGEVEFNRMVESR